VDAEPNRVNAVLAGADTFPSHPPLSGSGWIEPGDHPISERSVENLAYRGIAAGAQQQITTRERRDGNSRFPV
jgi:hypothetical protein